MTNITGYVACERRHEIRINSAATFFSEVLMKSNHSSHQPWFVLLIALGFPSFALAHTGVGDASGLLSGFAHPLGGLDHLCAMIGVGLWAAQRGGRAIWLVPLAFVAVMAFGGLLGAVGIAIPFVERGIIASVLILGILIAAAIRLPLLASALIVGAFALFHGHAHGAEMPLTASGLMYGIGFLASTSLLHLAGVGLGLVSRQSSAAWLLKYAGAVIVLCGMYLVLPG
jgi:urease accessory protein